MSIVNILFSVEQINRELDFRLVLACLCASRHNRIFVGSPGALMAASRHMRGGLYVGKNVFYDRAFPDADLSHYQRLKNSRFNLIWLDEEGALYVGHESRWRRILGRHIDPRFLDSRDTVCAWGPFQAEFYRSLSPQCAIKETGHPRFDLMKSKYNGIFEEEASQIRNRLGEFFLINTNRTIANNGLGVEDTFSPIVGYDIGDPARREDYLNLWAHASRLFISTVHLANTLSLRFPQVRFVIRPHPSEDHNFYKVVFRGVENITVSHEGGVSPWLLACRALIHNGCTTAIESHLAGKEVITFRPHSDERYDCRLPNLVGRQCHDESSVISAVDAIIRGEPAPPNAEFAKEGNRLLSNVTQDAFRSLADVIQNAVEMLPASDCHFDVGAFKRDLTSRRIAEVGKSFVRPFFKQKQREFSFYTGNGHFFGFNNVQIRRKLDAIQKLLGVRVHLHQHSWELLSITNGHHQ